MAGSGTSIQQKTANTSMIMSSRSSSKSSSPSNISTPFTRASQDGTHKSIWSYISTKAYICYHKHYKPASCQKKLFYTIITLCLTIYIILSCYIDVPYWFFHGIEYHQSHFGWKATFDGDYCEWSPLQTDSGKPLWNISQNNHNPSEYRSRVFLLSYPRSGNHLTRAMIECLLNKPTYGYTKEKHMVYIPRTEFNQTIAIKTASIENPFVRKIHTPRAIPDEFSQFGKPKDPDIGLIFLIRDPIECILSENKYVPYFWKDYQYQFGTDFMRSPIWYQQWTGDESKLLLYYEDYYHEDGTTNKEINLRKLAEYFGEEMVPNKQLDYCIENYDKVIEVGLGALQRKSTSNHNPHYYRDKYFGKDPNDWPKIKVSKDLYPIFERYDDIQSC